MTTLILSYAPQACPILLPLRQGRLCSHPSCLPWKEHQPCLSLKIMMMLIISGGKKATESTGWNKTWFCSDFENGNTSAIWSVGLGLTSLGGIWLIWAGVISSDLPSWGKRTAPLILVTIPSPPNSFVCKEKVSRSICLWNNYFKHGYNTDFSSNTEEIYLANFLSPTKNYTNISLNTTVKRTSRENLMFGTQKEK